MVGLLKVDALAKPLASISHSTTCHVQVARQPPEAKEILSNGLINVHQCLQLRLTTRLPAILVLNVPRSIIRVNKLLVWTVPFGTISTSPSRRPQNVKVQDRSNYMVEQIPTQTWRRPKSQQSRAWLTWLLA